MTDFVKFQRTSQTECQYSPVAAAAAFDAAVAKLRLAFFAVRLRRLWTVLFALPGRLFGFRENSHTTRTNRQ